MKKLCAILAVMVLAVSAFAVDLTITNYFPNYVSTETSFTDAGDTGLTTGRVYACFWVGDIDQLSASAAHWTNSNSSISALIRGIVEEAEEAIAAAASTNRPTKMTVDKTVKTSSGTADLTEVLRIETEIDISAGTVEGE